MQSENTNQLTPIELQVLREANGDLEPEMRWGASLSVAYEVLRARGYVDKLGNVTASGKSYLKDHPIC